jgi:HSP20 family protein
MRDLFDVHREMSRIFDDFFKPAVYREEDGVWDWTPAVDVTELEDRYELHAEVPGISEKDVHVSVTDNVLTLRGEKKHEKEEKNSRYHRVERSYGGFQRSFTLPSNLKADEIKATFKNGILTIAIPKSEKVKPKEIPITVG